MRYVSPVSSGREGSVSANPRTAAVFTWIEALEGGFGEVDYWGRSALPGFASAEPQSHPSWLKDFVGRDIRTPTSRRLNVLQPALLPSLPPPLLSSPLSYPSPLHNSFAMAGGIVAPGASSGGVNGLIHAGAWYKNPRLIKLNAWILLLLITSSTNGYDGQWPALTCAVGLGSRLLISFDVCVLYRFHDERSPDPQAMAGCFQQPHG